MSEFKKVVRVIEPDGATNDMMTRNNWTIWEKGMDTPDLVLFTGGADVSPNLYGEVNFASLVDPKRDQGEVMIFEEYLNKAPLVGICRGGQFLNVMSGGKMYQDVDGHCNGNHDLTDVLTGMTHSVTSTHHQMMRPSDKAELVATANRSTEALVGKNGPPLQAIYQPLAHDDVEVVYYEETSALCFQPHPEYYGAEQTEKYFFELLDRFFEFGGAR